MGTLPTFLGIGTPRAGTTWLYKLLGSHPNVYVPSKRKEVHFFDRYYERGFSWYQSFFPQGSAAEEYKAIGEITPHYLYDSLSPPRIAGVQTVDRLFVILRSPVDRAYSHYVFRMRLDNFVGDFRSFLDAYPDAIDWGFYSRPLARYFSHIDRDKFLVLIFEELFQDIPSAVRRVARFLEVDPEGFINGEIKKKVNPSFLPRHRTLYTWAIKVADALRARDIYWPLMLVKMLRATEVFGEADSPVPSLSPEDRSFLLRKYEQDIESLEILLNKDLSFWRK